MQSSNDLWLFFVMVFGVIALPGMDMAFVASSALTRGLRGGLTAVAGIVAAGMLHVIVGATGVAALMLLWPAAFNALLLAGALYMVWIGVGIWRASNAAGSASAAADTAPATQFAIFRRAALTCLLNPKAYAFMLAVFPAFIRSAEYSLPMQALRLGAVIAVTQFIVYGAVAVFVASARRWTGASAHGRRWTGRSVAAALIAGAALTLAFAWQPAHAGSAPVDQRATA
jgi:threonine/homoserine/homoserine lactone efflux protein